MWRFAQRSAGLVTAGAVLAGIFLLAAPPRAARAAGLLIADNGFGGVLEIKEHTARVTINNGVAVTEVTQVFQNTENRQVEALYTFPVPRGASVANFSMWINGKEMVGEVLEKQRARQIYESYKQTRRDPGLLEQVDYRTFEMRVFPIGPRAEQRVQIVYYQELDFDHDRATYVYPLASSTRQNVDSRTTGTFAINLDVKSEVPIVSIESPSHGGDFAFAQHGETYHQASLETRGGDLNRDVVIAYQVARPRTGVDLIATRQGGEDGYFLLTLTAGEELPEHALAMDYVFVLDISGSMNDAGKLDVSREMLSAFVAALGGEDRFEVIAFNTQPAAAFGSLRRADEQARADSEQFVANQAARGGTVLHSALAVAYKYADAQRPLNVVILSDGLTEQAERNALPALIRQRPAGSRVFCIGVGNDVNRPLLEQLATDSGGLAGFVSREDQFQRQAAAFRRMLLRPVATDVSIRFTGADVYDVEPQVLPNLYHGSPMRLYGRYKGGGDVQVHIQAKVLGQPLNRTLDLTLPRQEEANPEIERMWAWRRVDRLLKEADASGGSRSRDTLEEIVRLGEAYSIVTEYTSFIVLENDAEYRRWSIDRRNQLRVKRDRAAQEQLARQFENLRGRTIEELGPVAAAQAPSRNAATAVSPAAAPQTSAPRRNVDLFPGGGGAIDPLSALLVLSLVGAAATAGRRSKRA